MNTEFEADSETTAIKPSFRKRAYDFWTNPINIFKGFVIVAILFFVCITIHGIHMGNVEKHNEKLALLQDQYDWGYHDGINAARIEAILAGVGEYVIEEELTGSTIFQWIGATNETSEASTE